MDKQAGPSMGVRDPFKGWQLGFQTLIASTSRRLPAAGRPLLKKHRGRGRTSRHGGPHPSGSGRAASAAPRRGPSTRRRAAPGEQPCRGPRALWAIHALRLHRASRRQASCRAVYALRRARH
jgi:hypothetical protein